MAAQIRIASPKNYTESSSHPISSTNNNCLSAIIVQMSPNIFFVECNLTTEALLVDLTNCNERTIGQHTFKKFQSLL